MEDLFVNHTSMFNFLGTGGGPVGSWWFLRGKPKERTHFEFFAKPMT